MYKRQGHTVLIEGNATSQLGRLIRTETGIHIPEPYLKYSGIQFSVEEIERYLRDVIGEVE